MGQKVNPINFRVGTFLPWRSRWFADTGSYKKLLLEDIQIRKFLMERLSLAGIVSVEIERLPNSLVIRPIVSRPGVVIGRGGSGIEEIRNKLVKLIAETRGSYPKDLKIDIPVTEVKNPEISAQLVAVRIASELERRMPHRRTVTKAMERVMSSGALGIKIVLGGRIAGADISRTEKFHKGSVPTQTLRSNIDYAQVPAMGKRGYIGVKVWVHKPKED
jgi:small subunit ribosomal protein S3